MECEHGISGEPCPDCIKEYHAEQEVSAVASNDGVRNAVCFKQDTRPQKYMWKRGNYGIKCRICGDQFMGDKRALECADCAYDDTDENAHSL